MGYYINTPDNKGKTSYICNVYGGELIPFAPKSFSDIPRDKALIVIVDNGLFEAAGYAYSENEFKVFTDPRETRYRDYVLIDLALANQLAV
jgi:hypothetical protein